MKKIKKILSVVSASVLCALPTANATVANATETLNTYRMYVDVKENSGISSCTVATRYVDNMTFIEEQIGNLGGKVSSARLGGRGIGDGTKNQYVECYYKASGNLALSGTLFTMKYISNNTYKENESMFEVYLENSAGTKLSDDLVSCTAVLVGDANNNGIVDISDAVLIKQFLANPSEYPLGNVRAADANNDGVITDEDATLIQQYLANLIKHF